MDTVKTEQEREAEWEASRTREIRDIFAATALAGMTGQFATPSHSFADLVAKHAYEYADALLAERAKRDNAPTALYGALKEAIEQEKSVAKQLDDWAHESRAGGWSTHQVDPMRKLADTLRRKVAQLERALAVADGQDTNTSASDGTT